MKKLSATVGIALALAALCGPAFGWPAGWAYRKEITVQDANVNGTLTSFPLYVKIAGDTDVGANAQSNGYDILFTGSDATTPLAYEREAFGVGAGAATGSFWVNVPTINSSGGAKLYMYYGSPGAPDGSNTTGAVWDDHYVAVHHLRESPLATAPQMEDFTQYSHDGTCYGSMAAGDQVPGMMDGSLDFDGVNDYVNCGTSTALNNAISTGSFTAECWVKTTQTPSWRAAELVWKYHPGFMLRMNTAGKPQLWLYDTDGTGRGRGHSTAINDGNWHHVVGIRDTATGKLQTYVDGVPSGTTTDTTSDLSSTKPLLMGKIFNGVWLDGTLDEARISDIVRSEEWIEFQYANAYEGDNELTWGTQQIPEPATLLLLGGSLLALARRHRRGRKTA